MIRLKNNKGSALILVLMVSLVLSAFGLVAMRDIALGVHQSASFRVRTQAAAISDGASSAFAIRAGNQANGYVRAIKASSNRSAMGEAIFGGNDMSKYNFSGTAVQFQEALASHGGFIVFQNEDLATAKGLVPHPFDPSTTDKQKGESGLFRGPDTLADPSSFEVQKETEFLVVLRDLKDGIPAPGFSERYCFKKATVASRASVGAIPTSFDQPATYAVGTHANEFLMGPIECGYN